MLAHQAHRLGSVRGHRTGQEGLVARAVERRTGVVHEPAVAGNVGADARHLLDRSHAVDRDPGRCGDGAAGLSGDPGGYPVALARLAHHLPPLGDRRCLLAFDVGHADSASHGELGQTAFVAERSEGVDGLLVEAGHEHLRADVRVESHQLQAGLGPGPFDRPRGLPRGQAETELGVVLSGHDELVGVGFHSGCDAQQSLGDQTVVRMEAGQAVQLVEAVDDDPSDPCSPSVTELVFALVVPVQHQALGRHPGREGDVHLSSAGHVEVHPLLVGQTGHGTAEERLARVGHALAEGGHRFAAPGPEVGLVVDEQGGAVLLGQGCHVDSGHQELTVGADLGVVRQQGPGQDAHIDSGASTPSRSSPIDKPIRADSTNHSRAWVSCGVTSSPIT